MRDPLSSRSTATADQRARVVAALRTGPKTSYDLRCLGAYQCSTRIFKLRRSGLDIRTTRVTVVDRYDLPNPWVAIEPDRARVDERRRLQRPAYAQRMAASAKDRE